MGYGLFLETEEDRTLELSNNTKNEEIENESVRV